MIKLQGIMPVDLNIIWT